GKIRHNYKSGSYGNDYTFTGKELDSETSLQYFGARYYSGIAGRFTSEDPVFLALGNTRVIANILGDDSAMQSLLYDPQQWNSYAYARNNPLANKDNNGNYIETVIDLISFALSLQTAYRHPTVWNGAMLGLDTSALAFPVPAVAGYIRYGSRIERIARYFDEIASVSSFSRVDTAALFVKNIGFSFSRRAWSAGKAGDSVASLVGHYAKHADEVGATSVADYYNKANDFISSNETKVFTDPFADNGDIIHYNPTTREKAVTDASGTIRSYYVENRHNILNAYNSIIGSN
ncbi:MAG: hypothetical protein QG626_428, partial [Patescibacteria group bacterium]|nr:hypothetical protein [Patescibacteria group bacterium]